MAWSWRYEDPDGGEVHPDGAPAPEGFPTQSDAESWLGETWRELLEAGVAQVTLLEEGREVYGPMGLAAE
jgi:hypothetical protein